MSNTTSPGAFAKALQERRRRQNRRKLFGIISGAGVLLVGALVVWLLFFSSVFAVTDVRVTGNQLLATEEVVQVAGVQTGLPLLTTDIDAVGSRVAGLVPVEGVTVERSFPGTIAIEVTERTLVYQRLDGAQYQWVDRHGVVFNTASTPEAGALVAETATAEPRLLADVATVATFLPEELLPRVQLVTAAAVDQIEIGLTDGDVVVWGSAEQSELKAEVLTALLSVEAEVYDVSAPGYPTTK
ncbi:FtsQ-type POTRA domain-containing protein [Tessaracoccus rhinocerotis]|uniref:FtsQ-type POTRA domain-containing protein n=1 Tax=Tessaracoccus rhinocerotis TaxID=1689449 RepID=A0A553K2I0_9ACTN|nr:FtsQ-type POTRA domain-containing protein [Tessaracoccus rhinocerotis]TRY18894.1 FtsQ-type POTRA domain-containing protein [Tessaracoccus rhinocerotis]